MQMITDEYRLLRRIGRGGMGEVWEAARIKENGVVVPCAIKLLHADITETARERTLFFDEARIATQLDHSRIVKVIDVGTAHNGQPFLVMERVDGVDLRFFWKEAQDQRLTPLAIDIVTYIVGEVLAGLDYAHDRTIAGADAGIVHSDVTPGNILISSSGEVKLTDFGIARFAATAGPMSRAIGTPRYMAPEQFAGNPRRETDIYGLGVVLHELLNDRRFLDGLPPDEFRARVMTGPPPELERVEPIPAWLDQLRRRMIATDYRDRPRASEARAVLVEHCPRYLAAGEQLKSKYYARLIGRRRSGVTQLLARVDDAHAAGLIPQIGPRAIAANRSEPPPPTRTYTAGPAGQQHLAAAEAQPPAVERPPAVEPRYEHESIESTEVLALAQATAESSGQEVSLVGPPAEVDRLSRRLRLMAMASGIAAVALLIPVAFHFLEVEPADVSAVVERPKTPPESAPPSATQEVAVTIAAEPKEPTPEAPTLDPPKLDPAPVDPAPVEPPKPKPKPSVTITTTFIVQAKSFQGSIKVGNKIKQLQNKSAFLDLRPGTHTVRLQPAGSSAWTTIGQLTITDIRPLGQQVYLWFDSPKLEKAGTFEIKGAGK